MSTEWFVVCEGKEQGPLTAQDLKELASSGKLQPIDLVRRGDMTTPRQASTLKGLFPVVTMPESPTRTSAEVQQDDVGEALTSAAEPEQRVHSKWSRLRTWWSGLSRNGKIGVAIGCVLVLAIGFGGTAGLKGKPLWVLPQNLYDHYKENQVAADKRYKGKTLELMGIVGSVKRDIMKDIYVKLEVGGRFEIGGIQCYFDDTHAEAVSALRVGRSVKLRGRCDGLTLVNVIMRHCELVPTD